MRRAPSAGCRALALPDLATGVAGAPAGLHTNLRTLVGSGDRIALFTLPFVVVGIAAYAADATRLAVDASSTAVRATALVALGCGLVTWGWSAALILRKVPEGELITSGPYAVVKHPLHTGVGLLVLPAAGILLGTWLGAIIGVALYVGARLSAPAEERELRRTFGARWEAYEDRVLLPWL